MTLTKIQLEECKQAINDYIADEFGEDSISDFSDLTSIGLAYTTLTDDEIDIQVSLDLENLKLKTYIGDVDCSLESLVEEIDITFDQPFLYVIRDKDTGEVWFTGTVYEPTLN